MPMCIQANIAAVITVVEDVDVVRLVRSFLPSACVFFRGQKGKLLCVQFPRVTGGYANSRKAEHDELWLVDS